ncbi:MAG TPA: glycoside hydrolase, partial [Bacteroidales bacterium]|nr:glycoside hydrolase [Bacteroidales bacterium]
QFIITDSWEAGVQNWTDNMPDEFKKLRGYDMLPWMPVITGQIVESAEASEKFLWDFRKTISDLTTINHYDQLTTILQKRDMGRYTESHEGGRAFIGDGMEVKRKADIPMSATWTPREADRVEDVDVATRYKADVLESASVAHIYGQNLVAAESMTARGNSFAYSPERLKPTADMELAMGLNLFVIHTSVHQPVDDKKPGLGLGPYGQWFTRHETWAEQAESWIKYLARSSFMLQQGKFVADILYYYGEDSNITALFGNKLPEIPEGFRYDFLNSDALINILSVKAGKIITPSGMNYMLLALDPNSIHMPLPVLRKLRSLVQDGAVVSGPKPIRSPSLSDDQEEFNTIVNELWANQKGENIVGKGKILAGMTPDEAIKTLKISPDFTYTGTDEKTTLLFVHRKMADADIYWVKNRNNRWEKLQATFRISGRQPEIWHPVYGKIYPVSYTMGKGEINVPLNMEPNDALFVVFRKKTNAKSVSLPEMTEKNLTTIRGPWELTLQPDLGAPEKIALDDLSSWTDNNDPGVKYFSGTGTYTRIIKAEENWFNTDNRIRIDLGNLKDLAEVLVNGKSSGIVWKTPFRLDITDNLKPGDNTLEIKVTNLWVNRLIGDVQPDVKVKYTYTTIPFYQADAPLLPSGLLGPVQILSLSEK